MSTRVLYYGAVALSLILFAFGTQAANASCCGKVLAEQQFTCGPGLPCAYSQTESYCANGGCRDCIDCAGSGQCTCGTQTYCTAVTFKCGLGRRQKAVLNLRQIDPELPNWVEVAIRTCSGKFERFDRSVRAVATKPAVGGQ